MHHIRRQRWQISAANREAAFAIRGDVRLHLDDLTRAFERGFDAIDHPDRVIHIPKLTLHLRARNADELVKQLPEVLTEQLRNALLAQATEEDRAAITMAPEARLHNILLQYLATGTLAWPELSIDVATQIKRLKDAAQAWLSQQRWSEFHLAAPNQFIAAIPFFQRLLPLLDMPQRTHLHELALQSLPQMDDPGYVRLTLIQALSDLPKKFHTNTLNAHQQLYLQAVQLASIAGNYAPDVQSLIELLRRELGATAAQIFIQHLAMARVGQTTLSTPAQTLHEQQAATTPRPLESPEAAVNPLLDNATPPSTNAAPTSAAIIAALFAKPSTATDSPLGLRVHAAGLILLHPYLAHLFNACEIALDAGRIAAHDLPRAAALLHWLACGRDEIFEFELGAIKLLLGLHPEDPLPVSPGLIAEREKEECHALLTAVISHWTALGATSTEGMQVSFLQRQGLLTDTGDHWQLLLEPEAFDVLLAQLPWSISLTKLSWMTKPIFTDWPTR